MLISFLVHPGWSPWHHRMPERFWDMQYNKHFETEFSTNVDILSWFTQVGVHGITVCLSTSGICNITNVLRQNFRQMLYILFGLPTLESWHHRMPRGTSGINFTHSPYFFWRIALQFDEKKVILVLLSITPLPQKQSCLKDKPLKKRFGIIALFYYRT